MNKTGVIIIEGHVQGLANLRSLGRKGIPGVVLDTGNCVARYSKYCLKFFPCPDYLSDDFVDFLVTLAEEENLQNWILLPSNDHIVLTISRHRERLMKYYKTIVPDLNALNVIYDKVNLLSAAKKCCIPIPITEKIHKISNLPDLSYPVITKGRKGLSFYKATGRKAFKSESSQELKKDLKTISQLISLKDTFTQEVIPFEKNNKTISFTAFCIDGEIMSSWSGVKLMEHPIEFGTATLAKGIENDQIRKLAATLLNYLKFTGVCEVEFLRDLRDNEYKLIEINPRTWLWVGLAIHEGVDYPLYIYNYLNRIKSNYSQQQKTGRKWYNPYTNFVFCFKALIKKKITIGEMIKLNRGKKVNALLSKDDILPFFAYAFLLLKMVKNR